MKTRKMLALLTITALSVAALSTASLAQDPRGPMFPFEKVDADKDGKVTKAELDAYRAAESTAMDANADGKLSVEELTAAQLARMTERATAMATKMVENLDTDGDKALSAAELAARPMPAMLFDKADADGDGAVTKAEADALVAEMEERMGGHHGMEGRGKDGHGKPGHRGFWDMMGDN